MTGLVFICFFFKMNIGGVLIYHQQDTTMIKEKRSYNVC